MFKMVRRHLPELDNLDSPLVSPSPLTSVGGIPGSAIAEKIFNDPDSWDNPLGPELEEGDPEMAWLAEEVEKLERLSMNNEQGAILSMEQSDLILRAFPDHYKVTQMDDNSSPRFPVYEGTKQDVSGPLSMSPVKMINKDIKKKGKVVADFARTWEMRRLRPPPSPLNFSPPSSSDGSEDFNIQLQAPSPLLMPSKDVPDSTTWAFLEWYGIHPESPGEQQVQSAVLQPRKPRPRGVIQGSAITMHVLARPLTSPPKVPLPPIPAETTIPDRSSSSIRRLPAVPSSFDPLRMSTRSETTSPALPRRGSPVPSMNRCPSESGTLAQSAKLFSTRRPSEPWSSMPSAIPSASSLRTPSVRSPPPAGPRPKGFVQRERESLWRTAIQSPPRTLATRPPALNL